MRRTSVRKLHVHTSELVREAAEGGIIVIERRGEPVAELRPISVQSRMAESSRALIFDSMREFWTRMPQTGDCAEFIEDDRNR